MRGYADEAGKLKVAAERLSSQQPLKIADGSVNAHKDNSPTPKASQDLSECFFQQASGAKTKPTWIGPGGAAQHKADSVGELSWTYLPGMDLKWNEPYLLMNFNEA